MKIKKISGFKETNNKPMFLVCWEDSKWSWEEYENISSVNNIKKFYSKLLEMFQIIEAKKRELADKIEEKNIISQLTGSNNAMESINFNYNNETQSTLLKGNDRSLESKLQRENFMNDSRFMTSGFTDKRYYDIDAVKRAKGTIPEHRIVEIQKPIDLKKKLQMKVAQISNFKSIDAILTDKIRVKCLLKPIIESFPAEIIDFRIYKVESLDFLINLLFSLKQKRLDPFFNLYDLQINENNDDLGLFYINNFDQRRIFVDDSNQNFTSFLLLNYEQLKCYDIDHRFSILQIKNSDLYKEIFSIGTIPDIKFLEHTWKKDSLNYFTFVESNYIFNLNEICKEKVFNFSLYSDNKNRLFKELKEALVMHGGNEVPLTQNNSNLIFIDKSWVPHTNLMPFFYEKLEKEISFFVTKFDYTGTKYNVSLSKIYDKGGIVTFTKDILMNPSAPGLLELFEIMKRKEEKWNIKITKSLCDDFERLTLQMKNTIQYAGMFEILERLKMSIEELDNSDPVEYLRLIKMKYFHKKRFFLLISEHNHGNEIITPLKAVSILKKDL
ncbi:hypothetical protein TUBRATIS_003490 [Tubulinosema ratisbonensis]|uniref:Chromo domain-containing protein n=1 Tax=Tubulinosema ratisbonensis TaxID=291195 RepID=A0A437AQ52_9MICR|nr:hypothetical protein TUBRATIS_003490 [Tubulinosema ratisbonensis]